MKHHNFQHYYGVVPTLLPSDVAELQCIAMGTEHGRLRAYPPIPEPQPERPRHWRWSELFALADAGVPLHTVLRTGDHIW